MAALVVGTNFIPTMSPEDVGEIAAQTVLSTKLDGKRLRLTGLEAISFPEAGHRISALIQKPIKHFRIPLLFVGMISMFTLPFNPFLWFIYWSMKLLNHFPYHLVKEVPQGHKILLNTFQYSPTTFNVEVEKRFTILGNA
jgi:hypothetical protein